MNTTNIPSNSLSQQDDISNIKESLITLAFGFGNLPET